MVDQELDCNGLRCPMPVLRAAKALRALQPGQVLAVTATDKVAIKDFQTFCREAGHELLEMQPAGDHAAGPVTLFTIRRGNG